MIKILLVLLLISCDSFEKSNTRIKQRLSGLSSDDSKALYSYGYYLAAEVSALSPTQVEIDQLVDGFRSRLEEGENVVQIEKSLIKFEGFYRKRILKESVAYNGRVNDEIKRQLEKGELLQISDKCYVSTKKIVISKGTKQINLKEYYYPEFREPMFAKVFLSSPEYQEISKCFMQSGNSHKRMIIHSSLLGDLYSNDPFLKNNFIFWEIN